MTKLTIAPLESRSVLVLNGKDVWSFLQNLITNDMKAVGDTKGIYAALLTAQGKFLHDFFILKSGDSYLLDCAAERKDDLIRRLTLYKLRSDVAIGDGSWKVFALFGEGSYSAAELPEELGGIRNGGNLIYFADPRNLALGIRIYAPADYDPAVALAAAPAREQAYDAQRLSLGIPEGGRDILPEKNFLLEANFEELNGVSFSKGCYVGQELTARTKHRGKIKKRLFRIEYDGVLHDGDKIIEQDREVAEVRSFADGRGLALVRLDSLTARPIDLEPKGVKFIQPDYVNLPKSEEQ